MSIHSDLFRAILSLDAYNRGYNKRLSDLLLPVEDNGSGDGSSVMLGDAKLLFDSQGIFGPEAESESFYAIAYQLGDEKIISYRGTDKFFQDGVNGYAVGAGFTGIFAPQGELALEFYSNVTDQSFESKDMRELVW